MKAKRFITRCILAIAALAFTSCDNWIFIDEGDCGITYKVHLRFDYNLLNAGYPLGQGVVDAAPAEVDYVTLYALNPAGQIVWQGTVDKQELQANDYYITLPVPAGEYQFLAWAGGRNDNGAKWQPLAAGDLLQVPADQQLARRLALTGENSIDTDIDRLYYGKTGTAVLPDAEDDDNDYARTFIYEIPLVKNTNQLQVLVQQRAGEPVDPSIYKFELLADNAVLDRDNNPIRTGLTTYYPWRTDFGEGEIGGRELAPTRAAMTVYPNIVAEFNFGRLMAEDLNDVRLNITNKNTGDLVLSMPIIQYMLKVRSLHYNGLSSQEYLDRQDDCSIVIFLDEGTRWLPAYINVLSWRVVLQQTGL